MKSHVTVPSALLLRARSLSEEHGQLEKALAEEFDTEKAKRLGEIQQVATAFRDLETAESSLGELQEILKSSDTELHADAHKELEATKAQLGQLSHNLTVSLTPKHPFAHMSCLIEIRPGPGGQEGRLFACSIYNMYRQFCLRKGYRSRVVKVDITDGASNPLDQEVPIAEAIIEILDDGAYGEFRTEAGMHRVQRVPKTEKMGRTHTSAVAVWVMPSFPETESDPADWENPDSDFYIASEDVKLEKMRASGAGGQHVNKTESAIRLTHIPTGIQVSMQDNRSQHRNREVAWRLLRSRVAQVRREEREEEAERLRNTVLSKDKLTRADKIRTYNYGQDRCSDHRSGLSVHNLPDVLAGGDTLGKVIDSAKDWVIGTEVRALIAEEEAKAHAVAKKD